MAQVAPWLPPWPPVWRGVNRSRSPSSMLKPMSHRPLRQLSGQAAGRQFPGACGPHPLCPENRSSNRRTNVRWTLPIAHKQSELAGCSLGLAWALSRATHAGRALPNACMNGGLFEFQCYHGNILPQRGSDRVDGGRRDAQPGSNGIVDCGVDAIECADEQIPGQ